MFRDLVEGLAPCAITATASTAAVASAASGAPVGEPSCLEEVDEAEARYVELATQRQTKVGAFEREREGKGARTMSSRGEISDGDANHSPSLPHSPSNHPWPASAQPTFN